MKITWKCGTWKRQNECRFCQLVTSKASNATAFYDPINSIARRQRPCRTRCCASEAVFRPQLRDSRRRSHRLHLKLLVRLCIGSEAVGVEMRLVQRVCSRWADRKLLHVVCRCGRHHRHHVQWKCHLLPRGKRLKARRRGVHRALHLLLLQLMRELQGARVLRWNVAVERRHWNLHGGRRVGELLRRSDARQEHGTHAVDGVDYALRDRLQQLLVLSRRLRGGRHECGVVRPNDVGVLEDSRWVRRESRRAHHQRDLCARLAGTLHTDVDALQFALRRLT